MKKYPFVKLPDEIDISLYLIREELKSRRLFNILHEIGFEECYYRPHLDLIILNKMDLDLSDSTFDLYTAIMEKRSKKINHELKSITKQALRAYQELFEIRKNKIKGQKL